MSAGTTSVRRSRLRTWIVLVGAFVGLWLLAVLVVWLWLRSEGDIRAVEAEVAAAGFSVQPDPEMFTDPLRLGRARRVDAAVQAIKIEWPGRVHDLIHSQPVSDDFRTVHLAISSPDVCAVAREIIALGSVPIRLPPGERHLSTHNWRELLYSRLVIADGEEFDLCLSAARVYVDREFSDDPYGRSLYEIASLCRYLTRRLADRREQMRPLADWLESMAQGGWDGQPQVAEKDLLRSFSTFRLGDQALREIGVGVTAWMNIPYGHETVMRAERASVLRAKLSWLQFLNSHPAQPRVWLDEADRRSAALAKAGSWLGESHQWLLSLQHPDVLRQKMMGFLYARLLAAELRGSPWPVDLCDRVGHPLRRWEKNGHLIGAYSVGPNGLDDGADSKKDILLRLALDPPPSPPAP